jgi:hypothetical protein
MDDDSDGNNWWSDFGNGSNSDSDSDNESYRDSKIDSREDKETHGEGADDALMHAMVLLGYRIVNGSIYWILQNSWTGPMQIMEFSNEYLAKSGAYIYFYSKEDHRPKPQEILNRNINSPSSIFNPSPVAESSQFERADCESWHDSLVHPEPEQKPGVYFDDFDFNDLF